MWAHQLLQSRLRRNGTFRAATTTSTPSSNATSPTSASNAMRSTSPPTACSALSVSSNSVRGHDYFRPFSCKGFYLCPSCSRKCTVLYAENLANEVLLKLPHRQFVFTMPKALRPFFAHDRRMFAEVSRLIHEILREFSHSRRDEQKPPGRRARFNTPFAGGALRLAGTVGMKSAYLFQRQALRSNPDCSLLNSGRKSARARAL